MVSHSSRKSCDSFRKSLCSLDEDFSFNESSDRKYRTSLRTHRNDVIVPVGLFHLSTMNSPLIYRKLFKWTRSDRGQIAVVTSYFIFTAKQ